MKAAGVLALIISLSIVAESKLYTRCKLAKIFVKAGLDNYGGFSLGNWICMAYYESRYNTSVQTLLDDGTVDYGIFQINSFTWCRSDRIRQKNHCHVACSALITDDLTDAILCAKKIVKETQGMNYWAGRNTARVRTCLSGRKAARSPDPEQGRGCFAATSQICNEYVPLLRTASLLRAGEGIQAVFKGNKYFR
ncbi:lysozyme-like protein 1 isoform X1 [Peromyscus maniculatus bairdii]|uniref:lysozyme-like protein 1 isoform X1 n=1 Tax=Peromyscus maniculatus bairdii TaxID=230844 RepID=UPI003FD18851